VEAGHALRLGDLAVRYDLSGHILGAASIRIEHGDTAVTFSGDIGRPDDMLMPRPVTPRPGELVVMESTYGNRDHPDADPVLVLADVARRTVARGGVLMIPSFAVGRSQTLLLALFRLMQAGEIPRVPVFLNSPMAIDVTGLYDRYRAFHRLSLEECAAAFGMAQLVRSVEESKELNRRRGPLIIIAGAGMLTGGRILHHLRAFGDDRRNTILLVGHQAEGTRGAALLAGAQSLKIHGRYVPIQAEVVRVEGFSAHAGQRELLDWLRACVPPPDRVYLVHGEPTAADCFRLLVRDELGVRAYVARDGETITVPHS
jgi:metallo-beta-lactamase family protein